MLPACRCSRPILPASGRSFCAMLCPVSGVWRHYSTAAMPTRCSSWARFRHLPARSALRWPRWKFGAPRISCLLSRRSRVVRMASMSWPTRSYFPTGPASTPWPWPRGYRRSTTLVSTSKWGGDVLWTELPGHVSAGRGHGRQDSTRREAGRPSSRAADSVRSRHQSDDCQGARPRSATLAPRPRRRGDRMNRRQVITVLGGAAACPIAARAQESGRIYRLGFAIPVGRDSPAISAFFDELRLAGFIEGQNLSVVPNGFGVHNDRLTEQAVAVVDAMPDAILTGPDNYTRIYQQLTRTIPLIAMTEDMVGAGLVASLARPDGNTTGISLLSPELDGKRQDLLIDIVPGARRMAALYDSTVTPGKHLEGLQSAARARGIELSIFGVAKVEGIVPAVDAAKVAGAQALNFLATPLFTVLPSTLFANVREARLPAIHQWPEMAEAGALAGYGPSFVEVFRQRARMVVKVLRGVKPADIPVEQPMRFELVINLQAAKAIGHDVPAELVLRADRVIE